MPASERRRVDVALVSDFRFPGGTSSSLATEIRVQAEAGYRTALVHLPSPVLTDGRPFNDKIRRCLDEGLAELVLADEPLEAELLVVRHPAVLSRVPDLVPDVRANSRVMVVNQVPSDGSQPQPFYSLAQVDEVARQVFGDAFTWAPIGPLVRDALLADAHQVRLSNRDWTNVLRTEEWAGARTGFVGDRPVIGRHSRPHWRKWPESPEAILAAYPDDARYRVRILGGADVPAGILGSVPANWEVLPFNAVPVADFLASIDFFVYHHHSGLVEAFGRAVIEAIASGAVAVLPPHFERLFGESCRYGMAQDVRGIVDELYADPAAYRAQSERATSYVKDNFGHQAHLHRLEELFDGALPSGEAVVGRSPASQSRVLVVIGPHESSVAVRRGLAAVQGVAGVRAVVVGPAPAIWEAAAEGAVIEVVPEAPAGNSRARNRAYAARLEHLLEVYSPYAVVVDVASAPPPLPMQTFDRRNVPVLCLSSGAGGSGTRPAPGALLDVSVADCPRRLAAVLTASTPGPPR